MTNNKYISRYAEEQLKFHRTDPTPWIPFTEEKGLLENIGGVAVFLAVIVFVFLALALVNGG